jgi:MFS family permease
MTEELQDNNNNNNPWKTLFSVSLCVMIVNIDYWSVAVALPDMAKQFHVTAIALDWVITAYIISFCASVSIAGRLGDLFGRKKLLLIGIVFFGIFSICVGLSDSIETVVAARVALGLGGGLVLALATAVLSNACSTSNLTKMLGLLTGMAALGAAIGPVVGGFITQTMGWQWIFYLNIPISTLAFIFVSLGVKESRDTEACSKIDYIGMFLLLVGITSLALLIAEANKWGMYSYLTTGFTATTIVSFYLFYKRENKIDYPLADLSLFKNRTFAGFITSGALSKMYLSIVVFTTTILLEKVEGDDPLKSGLFFLAISGSVFISSFFLSAVTNAIGNKYTLLLSLLLQIAGAFILLSHSNSVWLLVGLAVAGPGCSWGYSTAMVASITTLPRNLVGLASSASLTVIVMCAGIGITVAGTVIESFSKEGTLTTGVNASIVSAILACTVALMIAIIVIPKRAQQ